MPYVDPLFPLPAPDWILTHQVTLHRTSLLAEDTDDEGFPTKSGAPSSSVKAYVSPPDTRELERGGEAIDLVVLVRNDINISHRDQIEVPAGTPFPNSMLGMYRINSLRPNPSHTRALCTRISDPDGSVR